MKTARQTRRAHPGRADAGTRRASAGRASAGRAGAGRAGRRARRGLPRGRGRRENGEEISGNFVIRPFKAPENT